jgi:putative phosphoribosyl transferase
MGNVHVVPGSPHRLFNRQQAGRLLGEALNVFHLKQPVILGIPRGGLVVAREIARALDGNLDIVLSRKLRDWHNPELALGAVTETGKVFLDEMLIEQMGISQGHIDGERHLQIEEIERCSRFFRAVLPKMSLYGRDIVVADDGVATGATMQAALWAARQEKPGKLVCALPVGPENTVINLAESCDELVLLLMPSDFSAVGQFYNQFDQVEDAEVLSILRDEAKQRELTGIK